MTAITYSFPNWAFGEVPALTGSPKQIAWAEDLRRRALGKLVDEFDRRKRVFEINGGAMTNETHQAAVDGMIALAAPMFETKVDAKWWIEHQLPIAEMIRAARD